MSKQQKTPKSTTSKTMSKVKVKRSRKAKVKVKARALNEEFIGLLERLHDVDQARGKVFEAQAYKNAAESIMAYPDDITSAETGQRFARDRQEDLYKI